jgi:hypothetical protein
MNPIAVLVAINGMLTASVPPAVLAGGHVAAPLGPILSRFTERAGVLPGGGVAIVARGQVCTFHVDSTAFECAGRTARAAAPPFVRAGVVFLPLADVVHAFGGRMTFDGRTKTAAVTFPPLVRIATPAPFDVLAPQVAPTRVFTPQPPSPTPLPAVTGSPRPRRTAIPVVPVP